LVNIKVIRKLYNLFHFIYLKKYVNTRKNVVIYYIYNKFDFNDKKVNSRYTSLDLHIK